MFMNASIRCFVFTRLLQSSPSLVCKRRHSESKCLRRCHDDGGNRDLDGSLRLREDHANSEVVAACIRGRSPAVTFRIDPHRGGTDRPRREELRHLFQVLATLLAPLTENQNRFAMHKG